MDLVLVLLQLPATMMVAYLVILSCAALNGGRRVAPASPRSRIALLIPAHNEEVLLPRLLESIAALEYPRHLYDVHVVADNCVDDTASRAAAGGAVVHERRDEAQRGKGYALQWLLGRVSRGGRNYDGYVILDADSVVSQNFLTVMNRHLLRGDQAVQSYYGVLNQSDSWSSGLRYAALALFNHLRPRGRDALGLSAGLRGNGMCFTSAVMERFGWQAFTLAEDAEFHLHLVEAGVRVRYAAEASVLAEMPTSLRGARTQNVRWERGRLQLVRQFGPRLIGRGLLQHDPVRLDAVGEQLVPPLSVLTGLTVLAFVVTGILHRIGPLSLASLVLLGEIVYVMAGLWMVRAGPRIYLAFLGSPIYVAWKLWIYMVSAVGIRDARWIRTARSAQDMERSRR